MEQTLGNRIVHHRKKLGLTQDQLAERLGVTAQAVSKWEHDLSCPDINILPKLAEIFGISIDELLGREEPQKVHQAEVVDDDGDRGIFNFSVNSGDKEDGKWTFRWNSRKKDDVVFAIGVLWVGLLTLLSKIYNWDVSFWGILWPSAILIYGASGLLSKFDVSHLVCTLLGGYFLIANLGVWDILLPKEWIFPICVVIFGLGLLVDALKKPIKPKFSIYRNGKSKKAVWDCDETEDSFDCDLAFSENTYQPSCTTLRRGDISTAFGELTVDLQNCQKITENCCIDASCSFGQLTLLVPQKFYVKSDSSTAFASYSVEGQPDENVEGTIFLDASVSFGEILVKYI